MKNWKIINVPSVPTSFRQKFSKKKTWLKVVVIPCSFQKLPCMSKLLIVGSVIFGDFSAANEVVFCSNSCQDVNGFVFSIITGGLRVVTFSGEEEVVVPVDDGVEPLKGSIENSSVSRKKSFVVVSNLFG